MIIGALLFGKTSDPPIYPFPLIILIFRAIFDSNEEVEFKKKLGERIKHHDKDIERLCNVYYQGFIESVRELLEVRSQANKLNVIDK